MPKPDRDSLEYAAYKAKKRAARAAKREAAAAQPEGQRSSRKDSNGNGRLVAPANSTNSRDRSRSRRRCRRDDDSGSDSASDYSNRDSEQRTLAHRRAKSESPTKEDGGLQAPSPTKGGRNRSTSDVSARSFSGGVYSGVYYGQQPLPPPQGCYVQSVPMPTYGSLILPVPGNNLPPQGYGAGYSMTGTYGSDQPAVYTHSYPPPPPQNAAFASMPAPPSPADGYPSLPPPPLAGAYPTIPSPPQAAVYPPVTAPGQFAPGEGQAALQSTVPSVFQYQTGGPDLSPPPNLDPNNPDGPLPGEGAGKVYPPGQAPPQFNNPDYYHQVLSDSAATQSLTHSISTPSGPAKPSTIEFSGIGGGKPSGSNGKLTGKLGKLTSLGIPSLSNLSLSPNSNNNNNNNNGSSSALGTLPPPSPALLPYHGTYQSISPMPSPLFPPAPSPLLAASGSASVGNHQASGSFSLLGPPAYSSETLGFHSRPSYNGEGHSQVYNPTSAPSGVGPPSPHLPPIATPVFPPAPSFPAIAQPIATPIFPPSRVSSPSPERTYNPSADAKAILEELRHTFTRPSPKPLIDILPTLTPEELRALRSEYKSLYRGVSLAKHIKSVFTTSTPFGKVVFAVSLGPYASEAWFANAWYQRKETRNELLIESLMGKSNKETAAIKSCFRDAKYDASLEKAVADELPANKFRLAVMAQLSCGRMEEDAPLSESGIREDVARLGAILEQRGAMGGETEMVGIIVSRSDLWLRDVAVLYRQVYERDLAKAIMKHSRNLVGETLLHIINGAVDKPLRDAKLLDQAITALVEQDREDLLISRATRIHWDPKHLRRVKRAFKKKYGVSVGTRFISATKGSYREFLLRMLRED